MDTGAHEGKERPTTRNSVWTMKHLTHELVLPYKEALVYTLLLICIVQSLYTFHLAVVTMSSI